MTKKRGNSPNDQSLRNTGISTPKSSFSTTGRSGRARERSCGSSPSCGRGWSQNRCASSSASSRAHRRRAGETRGLRRCRHRRPRFCPQRDHRGQHRAAAISLDPPGTRSWSPTTATTPCRNAAEVAARRTGARLVEIAVAFPLTSPEQIVEAILAACHPGPVSPSSITSPARRD